jgi:hypothetical protein
MIFPCSFFKSEFHFGLVLLVTGLYKPERAIERQDFLVNQQNLMPLLFAYCTGDEDSCFFTYRPV